MGSNGNLQVNAVQRWRFSAFGSTNKRKSLTFFLSQLKLKIDFLKQPYVRGVTFFQTMILDIHVDFPIIFDIYVKFLGCLSIEPKCLPFIHSWICGSYRILWCFCLSDFQSDESVWCYAWKWLRARCWENMFFWGEGEPNRVHRVGCFFQGRIPYRLASFLIGHQEIRGIPSIYPPPSNSQHQIIIFLVRDSLKSFICTLLLGGGVDPRDTDCIGFCWDSPVNSRFLGVKGVRHFGWWVIMMASEWIAKESNCTNRIKTVLLFLGLFFPTRILIATLLLPSNLVFIWAPPNERWRFFQHDLFHRFQVGQLFVQKKTDKNTIFFGGSTVLHPKGLTCPPKKGPCQKERIFFPTTIFQGTYIHPRKLTFCTQPKIDALGL